MSASISSAASPSLTTRGAGGRSHDEETFFSHTSGAGRAALFTLIGFTVALILVYWDVFEAVSNEWSQPEYSHGWIIPLIALFIMWVRRPVSNVPTANSLYEKLKMAMGGFAALAAIGKFGVPDEMMVANFSVPSMVAGLGLAGACVAGLLVCLMGQPFAPSSTDESEADRSMLWGVLGAGGALVAAGLLASVLNFSLPISNAGLYQFTGLIVLGLGGIGVALASEQSSKAGLAEMVFGVTLVLLSVGAWVYAVRVDMNPLVRLTFITNLLGIFVLVGGLRLLKWAGPSVAFLFFMFPLPSLFEQKLLGPLQKVAIRGTESVFTLIGCNVSRQGDKLSVDGIDMRIIDACSGLSMTTILIAMAIAMALLINRPWWDKLIVLLSALPIALISNVFRIVATGLIWMAMGSTMSLDEEGTTSLQKVTHDYAGILLMMPFALGLYWLEFKVLSMLTVEEEGLELQGAGVMGRGGSQAPPV